MGVTVNVARIGDNASRIEFLVARFESGDRASQGMWNV